MVNVTPEQQQVVVEDTTSTTPPSLVPLANQRVHVVTEVATWFVVLVGIEFFTRGNGIGFVGIEPNPLWFPVVWAALRGGLVIGLLTAFAAALLHAIGYATIVGFDQSLIVDPAVTWPLGLFAGVAFLVGQARDKIDSDRRFARHLATKWQHEAEQQQSDLDMLQHVNRELKRRVFDRSFDFPSVMSTVASSTDGHAEKSFDVPLGMLVDFCGASKCSVLYVLPDGVIDLAAHRGWDEDDMLTRLQSMRHNHRVQRALVEARPIVTLSDTDVERSGPLLVAPLADASGVIKALLCIDDLPPARFDQSTVRTFLGIATWAATNFRRIDLGGVSEETWQSVQQMLNTSKVIGTPQALAERIFLEDARRTRYGVETVLVAARMVDARSGKAEYAEELESYLSKVITSAMRLTDDVFRFGFAGCYVFVLTACKTEHADTVLRRLSERFQARAVGELEKVDLCMFAPGQDAASLTALLPAITEHFFGAPTAGLEERCPVPEPCAQRSGNAKDFVRRLRLEMDLAERLKWDLSVCDFRGGEEAFGVGPMIARHLWNMVGKLLRVTDGIYVLGPNRCIVLLPCTTCLDATRIWQRLDEELGKTLPDGRYETVQSDFLALTDIDAKAALMHLIGTSDAQAQPTFEPMLSDNELGYLSFTDREFSSIQENTRFKDGEMSNPTDDTNSDEDGEPRLAGQQRATAVPEFSDVPDPEVVHALEAVLGQDDELVQASEEESDPNEEPQQFQSPSLSVDATPLASEARSQGHLEAHLAEAATAMRREAEEMHRQLNREAMSLREEIGAATAALREQTAKTRPAQPAPSHKVAIEELLDAARTQLAESLRGELDRSMAAAADKAREQEQVIAELRQELARVVDVVREASAKRPQQPEQPEHSEQPERGLPVNDPHAGERPRENLVDEPGVRQVGARAVDEWKLQMDQAVAAIKVDAASDLREELEAMGAGIRASEGHALQSELDRRIKAIRDHVGEQPQPDPEPNTFAVPSSSATAPSNLQEEVGAMFDDMRAKALVDLRAELELSVEQVRQHAIEVARAAMEAEVTEIRELASQRLRVELNDAADDLRADRPVTAATVHGEAVDELRQVLESEASAIRKQAESALRAELGAAAKGIAQQTDGFMRRDLNATAAEIRTAAGKALGDDLLATSTAQREQANEELRQSLESEALVIREQAESSLRTELGAVAPGIAQEAEQHLKDKLGVAAAAQGERAIENLTQEIEALAADNRSKADELMRRDLNATADEIRTAADKALCNDLLATSTAQREQAKEELRQGLEGEALAIREQAESSLRTELGAVAPGIAQEAEQCLKDKLGVAAAAQAERAIENLTQEIEALAADNRSKADELMRRDLNAAAAEIRTAADKALSDDLLATSNAQREQATDELRQRLESEVLTIRKQAESSVRTALGAAAEGIAQEAEEHLTERLGATAAAQGERAAENLTQEIEALAADNRSRADELMRRDLNATAAEIRTAADKALSDDLLATSNAQRKQASEELRQQLEREAAGVREQATGALRSELDDAARALTQGASQLLAENLGEAASAHREQASETLSKDLQAAAETIGKDLGEQLANKVETDVAAVHERSTGELRSDLEATVASIRASAVESLNSLLDQTAGERLASAAERLCHELEGFVAGIDQGTLPVDAVVESHADDNREREEQWTRLHERMVALKAGFDAIKLDAGASLPGGFAGIADTLLKQAQSYASANRSGSSNVPAAQGGVPKPQ